MRSEMEEQAIIRAMSMASPERRAELARELHMQRIAARQAGRAMQRRAQGEALVAPYNEISTRMHTTAATDWIAAVASTERPDDEMCKQAAAEADRWLSTKHAMVLADETELSVQAGGYARMWSGKFGASRPVAHDAFIARIAQRTGFNVQSEMMEHEDYLEEDRQARVRFQHQDASGDAKPTDIATQKTAKTAAGLIDDDTFTFTLAPDDDRWIGNFTDRALDAMIAFWSSAEGQSTQSNLPGYADATLKLLDDEKIRRGFPGRFSSKTAASICPYCDFNGTSDEVAEHIKSAEPGHKSKGTVSDQMNAEGSKTAAFGEWLTHDPDNDGHTSWTCTQCGARVDCYRGMGGATCDKCGAEYNAFGQRLRADWRGNPSNYDDDIGDMEGYEMQHAHDGSLQRLSRPTGARHQTTASMRVANDAGTPEWWDRFYNGDGVSDGVPKDLFPEGGVPLHGDLTPEQQAWLDKRGAKMALKCVCAHNNDGSVTTFLCPLHADGDPCATMASVTGGRRKGSIVNGVCSNCGWTSGRTASRRTADKPLEDIITGDRSTCVSCGEEIIEVIDPYSGITDWGSMFNNDPTMLDFGCSDSPDTNDEGSGSHDPGPGHRPIGSQANQPLRDPSFASLKRRIAADGMKCSECGASIERDPEGEEPRTYHHNDGKSHDHEAKPGGGDKKESVRRTAGSMVNDMDHAVLNAQWNWAFDALNAAGLEADADDPIAARYRAASDALNHANRSRDFAIATGRSTAARQSSYDDSVDHLHDYADMVGVTDDNYARAAADASLGVGHIWTNVGCPAYRTLDPADCICRRTASRKTAATVPCARCGTPVEDAGWGTYAECPSCLVIGQAEEAEFQARSDDWNRRVLEWHAANPGYQGTYPEWMHRRPDRYAALENPPGRQLDESIEVSDATEDWNLGWVDEGGQPYAPSGIDSITGALSGGDGNWIFGTVGEYRVQALAFDEGNLMYGMPMDPRISKLYVWMTDDQSVQLYNFDRGTLETTALNNDVLSNIVAAVGDVLNSGRTASRKQAWTEDGSDLSSIADQLMGITNEVEQSMGVRGYRPNDEDLKTSVRSEIARRIIPFLDQITDADLDALTDYNYHITREAVDIAQGRVTGSRRQAADGNRATCSCGFSTTSDAAWQDHIFAGPNTSQFRKGHERVSSRRQAAEWGDEFLQNTEPAAPDASNPTSPVAGTPYDDTAMFEPGEIEGDWEDIKPASANTAITSSRRPDDVALFEPEMRREAAEYDFHPHLTDALDRLNGVLPCSSCGKPVGPLEAFPTPDDKGILCLDCYANSPEGRRMPSADELTRMWGGPVRRGSLHTAEMSDEATELQMYLENDGDIYRQQLWPIIKNLENHFRKGRWDHERAITGMMYAVETAAKKYNSEFGSGGQWHAMFPPAIRREVAENMIAQMEIDMNSGILQSEAKRQARIAATAVDPKELRDAIFALNRAMGDPNDADRDPEMVKLRDQLWDRLQQLDPSAKD